MGGGPRRTEYWKTASTPSSGTATHLNMAYSAWWRYEWSYQFMGLSANDSIAGHSSHIAATSSSHSGHRQSMPSPAKQPACVARAGSAMPAPMTAM